MYVGGGRHRCVGSGDVIVYGGVSMPSDILGWMRLMRRGGWYNGSAHRTRHASRVASGSRYESRIHHRAHRKRSEQAEKA